MRRIAVFPLFTVFCLAISGPMQAQQQITPSNTSASETTNSLSPNTDSSAAKSTEKKVWTNEDLENLDNQSVTGTAKATRANSPKYTAKNTQAGRDAKWYRGEIAVLQAKIPPLDEKIHNLQAALSGQPVTSAPHYEWSRQDDWRSQLARLEKQRSDIEDKIANLEDEARHNGVPANTLP